MHRLVAFCFSPHIATSITGTILLAHSLGRSVRTTLQKYLGFYFTQIVQPDDFGIYDIALNLAVTKTEPKSRTG